MRHAANTAPLIANPRYIAGRHDALPFVNFFKKPAPILILDRLFDYTFMGWIAIKTGKPQGG
jgi:hypothetical protein